MCNKNVPPKVKGKMHATEVGPRMLDGMESMGVARKRAREMAGAERRRIRYSLGKTRGRK